MGISEEENTFLISVCIPVYNWDVRSLIIRLSEEISLRKYERQIEVIIMDDSSTDAALKKINRIFFDSLSSPVFRFIELNRNVGRSRIRNLLTGEASGKFILFLDADVLPDRADFLENYVTYAIGDKWDIVYGARSYETRTLPGREYDFYYYLGNKVEVKSVEIRSRIPWRYLWTCNILVRKSVFLENPLDERFTGYGYEDTEWAIRLCRRYKVLHIDNTVSHLSLISKKNVYAKMKDSIPNFALLAELHPIDFTESKVYRIVKLLQRLSGSLLRAMDAALERMFFRVNNNRLCLIMFQFNKAVLLAQHLKNRHSMVK